MDWTWIFWTFGFIGSLVAVLLFELVFRKAKDVADHREEVLDMQQEEKQMEEY
jgi:hypothetical protein